MTTLVSIHSFRGGTGKSNTSANLAAQLARLADHPRAEFFANLARWTDVRAGAMPKVRVL